MVLSTAIVGAESGDSLALVPLVLSPRTEPLDCGQLFTYTPENVGTGF